MRDFRVYCDRKPLLGGSWPAPGIRLSEASGDRRIRTLIVTGDNGKVHDWRKTSAAIRAILTEDARFEISVEEDPGILAKRDLEDVDVIVLDFKDIKPVPDEDKAAANLSRFVREGGGLAVIHWASAIFMKQTEIRDLVGRTQKRRHDKRGPFTVRIVRRDHPVTSGMNDFQTDDELFIDLQGDRPIDILATAKSKVTGHDHPMAFVFPYGDGRVFHTPLGHDAKALLMPGTAELIRRGVVWAAGREVQALAVK